MYTITKHDSLCAANPHNRGCHQSIKRTLNVHPYAIYPSKLLVEELGLTKGSHIAITFDEGCIDKVYIRRADDADDTPMTQTARLHVAFKGKRTMKFCNKEAALHILQVAGLTGKGTFYVSATPTVIGCKTYYRILTENPITMNKLQIVHCDCSTTLWIALG